MIYIGIDSGINGAIVGLSSENNVVLSVRMPKYRKMTHKGSRKKIGVAKNGNIKYKVTKPAKYKDFLCFDTVSEMLGEMSKHNKIKVCLEKQGCRPRTPCGMTMFNYGRLYQTIHELGVEYTEILPQKWKKHFGLKGKDYKDNKKIAIEKAIELGFESEYKTADIYEAFLIAKYYRDIEEGK